MVKKRDDAYAYRREIYALHLMLLSLQADVDVILLSVPVPGQSMGQKLTEKEKLERTP